MWTQSGPKGSIKTTAILSPGRMTILSDFRLLKIIHVIQTSCSGSSADSDEKGASTLTPAAVNCLA